jgi:hypothetical protein
MAEKGAGVLVSKQTKYCPTQPSFFRGILAQVII